MSFILEAQKRDAANIDPAAAAQLAMEVHRASRWRWIWLGIGALLLINVLVVGYFFNPFDDDNGARSGNKTLTAPTGGRELVVKPRERTGPNRTADNTAPMRVERPAQAAPSRPARSNPPPRAERSTPQTTAATGSGTAAASSGRGRVLTPEQAAELNIDLPDQPAQAAVPTPSFESAQPAAPEPDPDPKPQAASASADQPLTLADLSPADRAAFPKLEFSTHIFADDPALRAVVVNSKRLTEGESIGEMVLRAVTEEGILVDYRGQRVAVSVVETWN